MEIKQVKCRLCGKVVERVLPYWNGTTCYECKTERRRNRNRERYRSILIKEHKLER
jgi:hypothetical protein